MSRPVLVVDQGVESCSDARLGDVAPKSSCSEESDLETRQELSATNIGVSSRTTVVERQATDGDDLQES
jgi:hypothetical protein